jgi:DNA repair protein RecO (recombination protein O)
VTQSEAQPTGAALGGEQLLSVLYLNELLLRLITRHDPHPILYDHYRSALAGLALNPNSAIPLRRFERQLLQELGYGLSLERDSNGDAIRAELHYDYRMDQGACPLQGKAQAMEVGGDVLLALREDRLDEAQSRREARRLLKAALSMHLGQKPLQTPELFRNLRQLKSGDATASDVQP